MLLPSHIGGSEVCLELSLYDEFGDGWGGTQLTVSSADGAAPAKKSRPAADPGDKQPAGGAEAGSSSGHVVYVGGLPYSYEEEQVRSSFGECGEIVKVHRMLFADSGKFKGIALITFATAEAAAAALAWDGLEWEGRFLTIKAGKAEPAAEPERPKPQGSTTAYVGNLSYDASEADLRALFSGVVSVRFTRWPHFSSSAHACESACPFPGAAPCSA